VPYPDQPRTPELGLLPGFTIGLRDALSSTFFSQADCPRYPLRADVHRATVLTRTWARNDIFRCEAQAAKRGRINAGQVTGSSDGTLAVLLSRQSAYVFAHIKATFLNASNLDAHITQNSYMIRPYRLPLIERVRTQLDIWRPIMKTLGGNARRSNPRPCPCPEDWALSHYQPQPGREDR